MTASTATRTPRKPARARPKTRAPSTGSGGHRATVRGGERGTTRLNVPLLGPVGPPSRDQLVFLGGLGALAVVGVLDWPVAAVVGVGHLLAARRNSRALREVGEAMEQA